MQKRTISIINDIDRNKIVVIHSIRFKGKRSIDWKEVELYLREYVGDFYEIAETHEVVYIGSDFPDEYTNSNYTHRLKGASAKAKANAVQGLPELIEIATNRQHEENHKEKHNKDAQLGWERYESRFALPVLAENGKIERYNVFHVLMLIRYARDGRKYLYDIMDIKKETSKLFQSDDFTQ